MSVQVEISSPHPRSAASGTDRSVRDLITLAAQRQASDLLLIAGAPPTLFADGCWTPLDDTIMTADEIVDCIDDILSDVQREQLHRCRDLDFAVTLDGIGRVRANVHYQRGSLAAAFRTIPSRIPILGQLNLPDTAVRFAEAPSGLVLVVGGAGQGKSTTLAALIEHMNGTRAAHIITIEDPIEFIFDHGRCLIEQRQIGDDSPTFADALRHVLRQRPDVILIGEMRDRETVATALTAAETGHLILASLHTASTTHALARIIDVFPAEQQPQIRTQLAASLRGILCQRLVKDRLNGGLTPATEMLLPNAAVRRALRDNETHLISGMLETGRAAGMHSLEQSLADLVRNARITQEQAMAVAVEPARLASLLGRADRSASGRPAAPAPQPLRYTERT